MKNDIRSKNKNISRKRIEYVLNSGVKYRINNWNIIKTKNI